MTQYINKSALVAEIEKLYKKNTDRCSIEGIAAAAQLRMVLDFLNTLEVKEVDLEGEVESYWKQCDLTWCRDAYTVSHIRIMLSDIAKHFFELGLKTQKGEE